MEDDESAENLASPLLEEAHPVNNTIYQKKKYRKCGSYSYKVLVMILLIAQCLSMGIAAWIGTLGWNTINPMIDPIKRIVNKTDANLPTVIKIVNVTDHNLPIVVRIINETDYLLPEMKIILDQWPAISAIIQQANTSLPEIVRVINGLNNTLPHLESILKIVDSSENLKQINNLIGDIPELINVINFLNSSIPEIEYIIGIFSHKTTQHLGSGPTPTQAPCFPYFLPNNGTEVSQNNSPYVTEASQNGTEIPEISPKISVKSQNADEQLEDPT